MLRYSSVTLVYEVVCSRGREEGGRETEREGPGERREGERDYSPVFSSCWNASVAVVVK